jgi:hypothetical protein
MLSLKFRPVKKSDGTVRQSVVPQSVSICVAWSSEGMRGGGKAFRTATGEECGDGRNRFVAGLKRNAVKGSKLKNSRRCL